MDPLKFLDGLSAYLGGTPISEQRNYLLRTSTILADGGKGVVQLDAGAGKTLGYLIAAMQVSHTSDKPVIIATSTINNRNQIIDDYLKIVAYAKEINHPIGNVPLLNYRSAHDYCSISRIENLIARHRSANAPASVIEDLERLLNDANEKIDQSGEALVDEVLPNPIMFGEVIHINREDISISVSSDPGSAALQAQSDELRTMLDGSGLIIVTQAMLAKHRLLRDKIKEGDVAAVIVDECDRMLGLEFLSDVSISLHDLGCVIEQLKNVNQLNTERAEQSLESLKNQLAEIHDLFPRARRLILRREMMAEAICDAVFACAGKLNDELQTLVEYYERLDDDMEDIHEEHSSRLFRYQLDELIGNLILFKEQFLPPYNTEYFRLAADTDIRLFCSWDNGDISLHVVTITPGRSLKWLVSAQVPLFMTTAFLGVENTRFARQIGLFDEFHRDSGEIRMPRYGDMHFTYLTNMPAAIDKTLGQVSPDYITAVANEIKSQYKSGSRMLVLSPAYADLDLLCVALGNFDVPLYRQLRGANISGLRQQIIDRPGILLTVLWEGYNLATPTRADGRRGVIDTIVLLRLPFAWPNEMVEQGITSIYGPRAKQWLWMRENEDVVRRVYQGLCRGIRGPHDKCQVVIMDGRFPPPRVMLRKNPLLPTRPNHGSLIHAIPERYVHAARNFSWKKHNG